MSNDIQSTKQLLLDAQVQFSQLSSQNQAELIQSLTAAEQTCVNHTFSSVAEAAKIAHFRGPQEQASSGQDRLKERLEMTFEESKKARARFNRNKYSLRLRHIKKKDHTKYIAQYLKATEQDPNNAEQIKETIDKMFKRLQTLNSRVKGEFEARPMMVKTGHLFALINSIVAFATHIAPLHILSIAVVLGVTIGSFVMRYRIMENARELDYMENYIAKNIAQDGLTEDQKNILAAAKQTVESKIFASGFINESVMSTAVGGLAELSFGTLEFSRSVGNFGRAVGNSLKKFYGKIQGKKLDAQTNPSVEA